MRISSRILLFKKLDVGTCFDTSKCQMATTTGTDQFYLVPTLSGFLYTLRSNRLTEPQM